MKWFRDRPGTWASLCRALLSVWVDELVPWAKKGRKGEVDYSSEQKIEAASAFCESDSTTREAAIGPGPDRIALYKWKKELLGEGANAIMSDIRDDRSSDDIEGPRRQKAEVEHELYHAKLESALRKGAIGLVKKTRVPIWKCRRTKGRRS